MKPFLWIALDALTTKEDQALEMAGVLASQRGEFGFKVNLDYLLKRGIGEAVRRIASFNRPVFADLKMWNGSRTMVDVIDELVKARVTFVNVYALADNMIPKAVKATEGSETSVLGVTVLTHYDEDYCKRHFKRSLPDTVRHLADTALASGCHGIILPGTTLNVVSDLKTIKLVPGIRPSWFSDNRHEEEVEPAQAVRDGATDLVCGSPVTKSDDPLGALLRILYEIQ